MRISKSKLTRIDMGEINSFIWSFILNLKNIDPDAQVETEINFEIPIVKKIKSKKIVYKIIEAEEKYPSEKIIKVKIKGLKLKAKEISIGQILTELEEKEEKK